MTKIKEELIKRFNFEPSCDALSKLEIWHRLFLEYNSHTNLVSRNDEKFLIEKHVIDSLSISLFCGLKDGVKLLDVGCGGGFPSLILSIFFPEINVIALDSTAKKMRFVELVKNELSLSNLETICSRCENLPSLSADILVNRAVGKIENVWKIAGFHLKAGGFFVSYKALTARLEALCAREKFKELEFVRFIPYSLPEFSSLTRELVIFKKN